MAARDATNHHLMAKSGMDDRKEWGQIRDRRRYVRSPSESILVLPTGHVKPFAGLWLDR